MYAIMKSGPTSGISADSLPPRDWRCLDRLVRADLGPPCTRVKLGLKSKYYMNQKTSNGMRQVDDLPAAQTIAPVGIPAGDEDADCEACTL